MGQMSPSLQRSGHQESDQQGILGEGRLLTKAPLSLLPFVGIPLSLCKLQSPREDVTVGDPTNELV